MHKNILPIEVKLFTQTIYELYGYDFSGYSKDSFKRRLVAVLNKFYLSNMGECLHRCIHDKDFFKIILNDLTITVTELFRDPYVFSVIREKILPYIKTYPRFKVWHSGCATGEEVSSLAILLKECNLLERAVIYGTDINTQALIRAKRRYINHSTLQQGIKNYFATQSPTSLNQYIQTDGIGSYIDIPNEKIVFAEHNLTTDESFGEMQMIFCRNVLIYFTKELQEKVLKLLTKSLCVGGFLCLGSKESLSFSSVSSNYIPMDNQAKLYRKIT